MRTVLVLVAAVAVVVLANPNERYSSKYDNFNWQELVDSPRFAEYMKCFLNKGPCSDEGDDFKRFIPDAIATVCIRCTLEQRAIILHVVRAFHSKLPELWQEIQKEDPALIGHLYAIWVDDTPHYPQSRL